MFPIEGVSSGEGVIIFMVLQCHPRPFSPWTPFLAAGGPRDVVGALLLALEMGVAFVQGWTQGDGFGGSNGG